MSNKDDNEDFLTEDPEISSQKVVLLSFLSPEKILENKDIFMFKSFLKDYEVQWRTTKLENWLGNQVLKMNEHLESLAGKLDKMDLSGASQDIRSNLFKTTEFVEGFQQFQKKNLKEYTQRTLQEEFEDFMFKNQAKLEEEFFAKNEFRPTIRGIKVRGVYSSEAEATSRAKRLQKSDPNFNIYLGAVGKWMAWEPDPSKISTQEYANDQLNSLMKKYRENEEAREEFYSTRKNASVAGKKKGAVDEQERLGNGANMEESSSPFTSQHGAGAHDSLFSDKGDIAIQRKMNNKQDN